MKDSTYKLVITLLLLVIVVGGGMLLYDYAQNELGITAMTPDGTVAPNAATDFTVEDGEGNSVKLSDFAGKPVVVNFWASWCGPCKMEMPHFQTAWEEYGDKIEFLMVNMSAGFGDSKEDAQAVLSEGGYTFPVYYDTLGQCATGYAVNAIPVTLFINADGTLNAQQVGMLSEAALDQQIQVLLD